MALRDALLTMLRHVLVPKVTCRNAVGASPCVFLLTPVANARR